MDRNEVIAGVVIPFYQRTTGILSRCLQSIFTQDFQGKILIVVVDDSSPSSAELEIPTLILPENIELVVLKQVNAGPGIARNTGIDYLVKHQVDFIALLDSDDVWQPSHLGRAAVAFSLGAHIYSSSWILTSGETDALKDRGVTASQLEATPELENGGFLKKSLVEQECTTSTIKLSAFVITTAFLGSTRFDSRLRYASEDRLFILSLGVKAPKVFISLAPEVSAGRGVNIYESINYGTLDNFNTLKDKLNGRKKMKALLQKDYLALSESFDPQIERTQRALVSNLYTCLKVGELKAIYKFSLIAIQNPSCLRYLASEPYRKLIRS